MEGHSEKVSFIWSVADLLRGDYKASDYGKVILPFTVLRRLDCLLEPTKKAVLAAAAKLPAKAGSAMREMLLNRAAGQSFHNESGGPQITTIGPPPFGFVTRAFSQYVPRKAGDTPTGVLHAANHALAATIKASRLRARAPLHLCRSARCSRIAPCSCAGSWWVLR